MPALSFSVLHLRDFRLLLLTRMLLIMGLQSQSVIVGWQVYSLTKSTLILGFTGLTEAIPAITCALFAGHIVDISRPHRVYLTCAGTLACNTLMLYLMAGGVVQASSHTVLCCIFSGIFISGIARSFAMPSSFSLLPQIVARGQITSASAWLNSGFQLAAICGPAIAGITYGGFGAHIAWLLPVSMLSTAFLMLASISHTTRQYRSQEKREPATQSIRAGWRFILHNRILLSVMALDMFAVLFGGAVAMLPAYADQVLHVGSQGLGALRAAPALGAIIAALMMAIRPIKQIHASLMLWVVTGFGCCMIGFGLSTIFALSMIFLACSGICDSISVVIRATLMQLLTPDNMRGRVGSVSSMFIISSNEIGAFESGLAARFLGLVPSVVLGGVGTLIVVAVTALLCPQLRKMKISTDGTLTQ